MHAGSFLMVCLITNWTFFQILLVLRWLAAVIFTDILILKSIEALQDKKYMWLWYLVLVPAEWESSDLYLVIRYYGYYGNTMAWCLVGLV